jgi:drug/metabolite transporter (DMT)-like permease
VNNSTTENRSTPLLVGLGFAAVYVIWGSTYLGIRVAVASLPPLLLAGCRFACAGGLLYVLLRALKVRAPSKKEWLHAGISGILMASLGNGLVTVAEEHVPSNLAALLVACVPLYVALLDWLRPGGTRPKPAALLGVGLGLIGMLLLVAPAPGQSSAADVWGVLAVLGAGLSWAMGILYTRHQTRHESAVMGAAQQMLVGGSVLLCGAVLRGEVHADVLDRAEPRGLVAFGYLALIGSIVGYSVFNWLAAVSTPSKLSTIAYVNPVVAVILGWLVLGETLGARALWGALLVVAAVAIMSLDFKPRRVESEA